MLYGKIYLGSGHLAVEEIFYSECKDKSKNKPKKAEGVK